MTDVNRYLDAATRHERNDEPTGAAANYEATIKTGEAPRDAYVNLAVLYFVCNDGGYAAASRLEKEFLETAWERIDPILDEATTRFGSDSEIKFWRRYTKFILLGQELWIDPDVCIELLRQGDSLVPSFYLAGSFAGLSAEEVKQYIPMAEMLLNDVQEGRTVRERYLRSVLESALNRKTLRRDVGEWT